MYTVFLGEMFLVPLARPTPSLRRIRHRHECPSAAECARAPWAASDSLGDSVFFFFFFFFVGLLDVSGFF